MKLTHQQESWLNGDGGAAVQWAMKFNCSLGEFFDAPHFLPVASVHFAPDVRMGGDTSVEMLDRFVNEGVKIRVPGYLDPCHIDFEKEAEIVAGRGVSQAFVDEDRRIIKLCRQLGFYPTQSCIPYQTVAPPRFGTHLAWGDTGAAICANAIFGARTNFEGGPSALASALVGGTPAYGLHQKENRRGNLIIDVQCNPAEIADWGAIAAWAGQITTGYETVPVFCGDYQMPTFNMIKQLGVALASYGGHAMFHVVGATPEAVSLEMACQGVVPEETHVISRKDLDEFFSKQSLSIPDIDLVVFAAPQLCLEEVANVIERLDGRPVHVNTRLMLAIDMHVKAQADNAGLTEKLLALGGEFSTGTCFYPEAPVMREGAGWRTVVTNSAKLVNTLASAGYETALRRMDACLDAAVTGRLGV